MSETARESSGEKCAAPLACGPSCCAHAEPLPREQATRAGYPQDVSADPRRAQGHDSCLPWRRPEGPRDELLHEVRADGPQAAAARRAAHHRQHEESAAGERAPLPRHTHDAGECTRRPTRRPTVHTTPQPRSPGVVCAPRSPGTDAAAELVEEVEEGRGLAAAARQRSGRERSGRGLGGSGRDSAAAAAC